MASVPRAFRLGHRADHKEDVDDVVRRGSALSSVVSSGQALWKIKVTRWPSSAGTQAVLKITAPMSCFTWQVHRLPDAPEAYRAMITRPKAAPAQSSSTDLKAKLPGYGRQLTPGGRIQKAAPVEICGQYDPSVTNRASIGNSSTRSDALGCVSVNTRILTRRGWVSCEDVHIGDETIGYDTSTGFSRWTPVTNVTKGISAELWLIGHKYWRAQVTPSVQWWSETTYKKTTGSRACLECGWVPRGLSSQNEAFKSIGQKFTDCHLMRQTILFAANLSESTALKVGKGFDLPRQPPQTESHISRRSMLR